jgi:hypothetical protein
MRPFILVRRDRRTRVPTIFSGVRLNFLLSFLVGGGPPAAAEHEASVKLEIT